MKVHGTWRARSALVSESFVSHPLRLGSSATCLALAFGLLSSAVWPQTPGLPIQANGSVPGRRPISPASGGTAGPLLDRSAPTFAASGALVLSSSQIFDTLSAHPDAIIELKQVLAERLSQAGSPVQDNDITDEMLYSQIANSSDLRVSITSFLRTRGYVSEDDLRVAALTNIGEQISNDQALGLGNSSGAVNAAEVEYTAGQYGSTYNLRSDLGVPHTDFRDLGAASRSADSSNSSTGEPQVLRVPTPYNLRAMRDLYTQLPEPDAHLKRFGADLFIRNSTAMLRGLQSRDVPLDVPIGPDYVLG